MPICILAFSLSFKNPVLLTKEVEVDETFIGGKEGNRHYNKKKKVTVGSAKADKIVVLGLIERNGKVIAKVITNTKAESILPVIDKHVEKGATMLTDEWYAYGQVDKLGYQHKTIQHNLKIYVVGKTHTNTIENFWRVLKRGLYGIYHFTSEKHLNRYLDEFTARYNTRELGNEERFEKFLGQSDLRLKYQTLIQN